MLADVAMTSKNVEQKEERERELWRSPRENRDDVRKVLQRLWRHDFDRPRAADLTNNENFSSVLTEALSQRRHSYSASMLQFLA